MIKKILTLAMLTFAITSSALAQSQYLPFGDTDTIVAKEQPLLAGVSSASQTGSAATSSTSAAGASGGAQTMGVITNSMVGAGFPMELAIDPAAAAAAKFWTVGRIAAMGAVAVTAAAVVSSSKTTAQH